MPSTHSEIVCEATVAAKLSDTIEGMDLSAVLHLQALLNLSHGTGASQINAIAIDRDKHMTGPVELDLTTLGGFQQPTDPLRNPIGFDSVVALFLRNQAGSTGDLIVGAASDRPWTAPFNGSPSATVVIKPGGFLLLTAPTANGLPVTGLSKYLRLQPSGVVDCDIVVFGRDT